MKRVFQRFLNEEQTYDDDFLWDDLLLWDGGIELPGAPAGTPQSKFKFQEEFPHTPTFGAPEQPPPLS